MKNNIVKVLLWDKEICKLQWDGGYKKGFGKVGAHISFNPDYHNFGFDIDPLGIYSKSSYLVRKGLSALCRASEYEGLPRFLSGSLPDDWGNQVFAFWIYNSNMRSSEVNAVDKLAFIGRRGMGGLEFLPELYAASPDSSVILEELYRLAREIELSRSITSLNLDEHTAIKDLMKVGMSAGGKHPKAIIAINWSTNEIRSGQIPLPDGFEQYILKFRDSDAIPTSEIEYVYYLMACKSGIEMEECSLLPAGGANHFLTKRFDRKNGSKIHSSTLRALCGEVTSYDDIFAICRKLHLPYYDMDQLFRRAVFNYLAGVCDDHDKNFSFVLPEGGKWRLAPAYDETFSVNYLNPLIGDRHYMSIGESNRQVRREQLLGLAEHNDIKGAGTIIDEIAEAVGQFASLAADNGIGKQVVDYISGFIDVQIKNVSSK